MTNTKNKPPRWAENFLTWYCKPALLEDLQGDLSEYFYRNIKSKGVRRAKLIYIIDVFKFMRLYTIRKPEIINLLINWIMLGSYVKTSGRNIMRNKLFSFINITGLSVSLLVGMLLIGLLNDIFSYDQFHENKARIYRVISQYQYLDQKDTQWYASSSPKAGKLIKESVPGVEDAALFYSWANNDVKTGNKVIPLAGHWANEGFFTVFTFPLLQGNAATALKEPFSLVLTEDAAIKIFGNTDAINKMVMLGDNEYTITGVMKNPPEFSHLKFEMLVSLSTRAITEKEQYEQYELKWDNIWQGYTYLLLAPGTDLIALQQNLDKLAAEQDQTIKNTKIALKLQPLNDIALSPQMNNSFGKTMNSKDVWIAGVLAVIVLLSACFNYTNLSIARALKRAREIGVRKSIGATKRQVFSQFIVESVMIAGAALLIAGGLFVLIKPYFLSIDSSVESMIKLKLSPLAVTYFVLLALATGMLAGFLPALFFTRVQAIKVLRSGMDMKLFKNLNMRKVLIVSQFSVSLAFIAATVIGYKQYKHFVSFDLGFATDNIINIRLQDNKPELIKKELESIPEVEMISQSKVIAGIGNYYGGSMKYKDPLDSSHINHNTIDANYIPLHKHKLIAGKNFNSAKKDGTLGEVIVSENVLDQFKIGDKNRESAIGEIILINRKEFEIVGVVENYHYGRADGDKNKVVLIHSETSASNLNLKINSMDWLATMNKIEAAWKKVDQVHPLEASFYNDQLEDLFSGLLAMLKVIGFIAFLAISIAALGLLGMVVFTTETRLKEISIRKVMGANAFQLTYLLSKNILVLLLIATLIALPATYYFFTTTFLPNMKNHLPVTAFDLLVGAIAMVVLALGMITSQTLKASRKNPAEVLKSE
jgi:putative ABC transport system permease protein